MRISDWSSDVCSSDLTDRCDLRPKDGSRRSHASLCVTSAFASYPRQLSVPFGRHHEEDHILLDNDRLNLVIAYVGGDSGAAIRGGIQNGNGASKRCVSSHFWSGPHIRGRERDRDRRHIRADWWFPTATVVIS